MQKQARRRYGALSSERVSAFEEYRTKFPLFDCFHHLNSGLQNVSCS